MSFEEIIITIIVPLIASIIGGCLAIYGGQKATKQQLKLQEKLFEEEIKARRKEFKIEAKHRVLSNITGNIAVISDGKTNEQSGDSVKFFEAMNQVNIVFSDAINVLEANQVGKNTGNDIYELIVEMHKDLNLPVPNKKSILNPIVKSL